MRELSIATPSKIVLLVIDGLGGIPDISGKTELETAHTPNMDKLAAEGICGLLQTAGAGITPGSAPGHLGLFGYDPLDYRIGRGVLEALGINFPLMPGDIAARGNFCTIDAAGLITDRRAGRISTEENRKRCLLLDGLEFNGVKTIVKAVTGHRFVAVFRGDGLSAELGDTDPQQLGTPPKKVPVLAPEATYTADIVNRFLSEARERLSAHPPANMILLRGFSKKPVFPSFADIYKLKSAAIASYPMYRGLAKVVGMSILETGPNLEDELATLKKHFADFDFFFMHVKDADAAGEDGDFMRKVSAIEKVDKILPQIMELNPDVLAITGDHSTPATMAGHSWHPVPCLLYSKWCRPDRLAEFSEFTCRQGSLGQIPAASLMPQLMAHALKLTKYGA
ncbi:MAG: 2,3-bisphosphoglycerate-independent phosphoglycerate mutase [Dehalococcoidia bacterium]|nr:2,3-bisphosphoglycerate-independent phosphoglycerate mutase [Dehalococcoidia bacterium]